MIWYLKQCLGWQSKLLNYGCTTTLIKHVLQSLPIHILSTASPPFATLKQIQYIIANFFGVWLDEKRKYHWSFWRNLSFPYEEGSICVRMVDEVYKAFQYKQWWSFRAKTSFCAEFLKAKYCQRSNPAIKKQHSGESLVRKHMMNNRHSMEPYIH